MCGSFYLFLNIVFLFVNNVRPTKLWIGNNLDFMNSNSWEEGNPPCVFDTILFPEQYSAAFIIQKNLEIAGIVFSRDGVLLTENNANINFVGELKWDKKCKNKNHLAKIKQIETKFWFDPINWVVDPKLPQNEAIPHAERIPCSNDEVIINHHSGQLSIDLDDVEDLYMGDLSFGGVKMSASHLQNFLKTEVGQIMFKNADDAQVRFFDEPICGCHRPEVALEVQWRVCKYTSQTCGIPHCLTPITPTGHCCAVCGSLVKMHIDNCKNFNLKLFQKQVKNAITVQHLENDLEFHAEMVDDGAEKYLQLYITEKNGYNEKSTVFMEFLNDTLLKPAYRDIQKMFHSSGLAYTPEGGVSGWIFFFVTLFVIVIFFVIIYAHYVPENTYFNIPPWLYPSRYRLTDSPFVFARFENAPTAEVETEARGNVIMNVTYEEERNDHGNTGTTSFDNPMFAENIEKVEIGEVATPEDEAEMTTINLDKSTQEK